jgi:phenylacetate-coenzyme A ligase PaaK-like adenylate-forming protein
VKISRVVSESVDDLITKRPYSLHTSEKDRLLLEIIKTQINHALHNKNLKSLYDKQGIRVDEIDSLEKVPMIPVQMFKRFDLCTDEGKGIIRTIKSSGTTGQIQSRVPLNKTTALNQSKALASTLSDYLGKKRRIMLVIDEINADPDGSSEITARSAGIRGLSIYAKKKYYLLKRSSDGELEPDFDVMEKLNKEHGGEDIIAFGFTYIIWSQLIKKITENVKFSFGDVKIFHSGGWKKMEADAVSKGVFSETVARTFNTSVKNIHDFYGMAEQTGVIFVDCEQGNKHVPNFAKVIVRDPLTLKPCRPGIRGMIEVMSILADSYYSQAILTEDMGIIIGFDDCDCGRKGEYFRFIKRIEKAEIRGCGDTFRERTP